MFTVMKVGFVSIQMGVSRRAVFCDRKMVRLCCLKTCRSVRCTLVERSALSRRNSLRWRRLTAPVWNFMFLFYTTTTVLRPFFRDHLG